jgi:hypothetical protein
MNKKRLVVILLLVAFAVSAFAIGRTIAQKPASRGQVDVSSPSGLKPKPGDLDRTTPPEPAQTNPLAGQPRPTPESQEVPQYVVYGQVFRHIKELHRKADEEERQGRDGAQFRGLYKQMAKLDDREAALLDQVAAETNGEIEKLNARAMKIIGDLRAQHPDGKLAPGEQPPAPPAELAELSAQRRDLILQARERLRSVFGEGEFQRFDKFVQEHLKPGIRRLDNQGAAHGR